MLALTMKKEGLLLHVSKCAISYLKQVATGLPDNTMPTYKPGKGTKKKTTDYITANTPTQHGYKTQHSTVTALHTF